VINRAELVKGLAQVGVTVEQVKPSSDEFPYPKILVPNKDLQKLDMLKVTVGERSRHDDGHTWVHVLVHKMLWIKAGK
jgi:hypothetical protein